jgi:hypothetical protein
MNCIDCKFREKIVGDAHSKCNNEWIEADFEEKTKTLTATWNQWSCGFPNNFDPIWIRKCKKFESKIK